MKKLLEFIISGIVDKPKEVQIQEKEEEGLQIYNLSVAPQDMGKIIGRHGQIIRAIRNLLRVSLLKTGKRVQLLLEEKSSTQKTPKS